MARRKPAGTEAAETEQMTVHWGDRQFTLDDLTAADAIAMEDEFGEPLPDINFRSIKAIVWLVWLARRHDEPDLPFEEVANVRFADLSAGMDEAAEDGDRPTSASGKRGAGSARSGSRGSRASSASGPGSSSS